MGRAGKRSVRFRTSFSNTIYDVMTSRNWKETDSETDWDVHWAEREWVYEDLLVKNLKRMKRNLQRDGQLEQARAYDFMPLSFVLPREYAMFVEEFKRCGGVWIMKPIGSAQGRGIFLFSRLSEISEWRTDPRHLQRDGGDRDSQRAEPEAYIVQRYIENPYLVGGKKFDIRLYVLVTSFSPLVAFMYRGGFARFSHTRYSSAAPPRHGAVDQLFLAIERVIVRSLIAVQHVMIADKHCFELYGYDVLIDDELKPWLIEVNASPSLTANTKDDYILKCEMLNDTLDIVDVEAKLNGDERSVGGFDLVYDGGIVEPDPRKDDAEQLARLRRHVENEVPEAITHLGIAYSEGRFGLVKSDKKAAKIYRRAVELGDVTAMNCLGLLYENGSGVKLDKKKAERLYRMARTGRRDRAMQFGVFT
ncbi:hypothetical protein JL722_9491 [Aureococcus anophagefferens]|nr:hypothetical protein JL722_9491 [Aureococcus anophagefferens]